MQRRSQWNSRGYDGQARFSCCSAANTASTTKVTCLVALPHNEYQLLSLQWTTACWRISWSHVDDEAMRRALGVTLRWVMRHGRCGCASDWHCVSGARCEQFSVTELSCAMGEWSSVNECTVVVNTLRCIYS